MNFLSFYLLSFYSELFILINICVLLLFGSIFSSRKNLGFPISSKSIFFLSLQISFLSLILIFNQNPIFIISWNSFFIFDSSSYYFKLVFLIFFIVWLFSVYNFSQKFKVIKFEFWILALLSLISLFLIIQSFDLLTIYLSIEFQSLIFYILASFNRNSEFSTEAGIKYFILGALSSALLLLGISIIYYLTGLTHFNDLMKFFSIDLTNNFIFFNELLFGLLLIIIAFLFKFNSAPFHFWTPDVYEGSPTPVTLFFSIFPKISILILISRLNFFIFYDFNQFFIFLFTCCIFSSSLIGTFSAFFQKKWKRFITYSSISHVSFFLICFIFSDFISILSLFNFLFIYLIMIFSFFLFFLNLNFLKFPFFFQIRYLNSLSSLNFTNKILSFSLLIILFSMIGIPPLAGFFAKFFIFFSSVQKKIFGITFFILFFNCISCFYYLRIINLIYFNKVPKLYLIFLPIDKPSSLILNIFILVNFFLFLDLNFFLNLINLFIFSIFY
uniref:NADH dehydrogenase subunit 2 n=1 Tax=Griffithsia okiensis TaxID=291168 RepID=UPI002E7A29A5|nr:NADH dehydrogenase subunit 2 [Griffithsia okiensis]WQF69542.1 NADH dehydrogenase subunit 2 [Griffithsia okiensis]